MKDKYVRSKPQNLSLEEQKEKAKEIFEKSGYECSDEKRDILEDVANRNDICGVIASFNEEIDDI